MQNKKSFQRTDLIDGNKIRDDATGKIENIRSVENFEGEKVGGKI